MVVPIQGMEKRDKYLVLYMRNLDKSLWVRAASVDCVTVLCELYYTHWCLPDSLRGVCVITASLRGFQNTEIIRTSILLFLVETRMLKLVFLAASIRRWLAQ